MTRPARRRTAIVWFATFTLLLHVAAYLAMDVVRPDLRDPEYGLRVPHLRARIAEHPDRPLVVVVGSSRAAMGVRPAAWEAVRPGTPRDPLLFNMSSVGAAPIQQLITVRRLFADGFRPSAVLLEYWPPVLRQDGRHAEQARVGRRLRFDDTPVIRDYFTDPEQTERGMVEARVHSLSANREAWRVRALPKWLTPNRHADVPWRDLDEWGWLPGMSVRPDDTATRERFLTHFRPAYRDQFDGHTIHAKSDRALREAVALVRDHGARVGFLFLPESGEFRSWYPRQVEEAARVHLTGLSRELGVPVLDARTWMADNLLADGFHLSRVGAATFTERLGPAVAKAIHCWKIGPAEGR